MVSILQILLLVLDIAQFIVIAHIIMSWLINFQVLNLRQPIVAQIWYGLNRVLEPVYSKVRSVLPQMGGIDFAPLVVLLGIYALRIVIQNNLPMFF
ncbi:YggT family protein [Gemmobacter fulvus]|uniref:YggT family protein n=1 Tax=Gemmobacter fulvus TaxID=2840474 RepID=A0A975P9S1_9RHOB|nr:YggT family protein [Gemmobacter fulvus]MBT9247291.1 YggT family protein [Gemmobacter fulvus]MDQ1850033.1 YggT family protein [Gemmobacter fulvus]QWK91788.1 YggT family protein [Gemmobacter fulvus]